jgi:hypothetical protein
MSGRTDLALVDGPSHFLRVKLAPAYRNGTPCESARVSKLFLLIHVRFAAVRAHHGLTALGDSRRIGLRIILDRFGNGRMLYNGAALAAFKYPASHGSQWV